MKLEIGRPLVCNREPWGDRGKADGLPKGQPGAGRARVADARLHSKAAGEGKPNLSGPEPPKYWGGRTSTTNSQLGYYDGGLGYESAQFMGAMGGGLKTIGRLGVPGGPQGAAR